MAGKRASGNLLGHGTEGTHGDRQEMRLRKQARA